MGVIRGLDPLPPRKEAYEVVGADVVESADVCVIGSGAGGAVAAHTLVAAGHSVVLLERGGYYEGRDMNQRDMDMVPLLWKNGGFNFDDALTIAIAQGACLGGSTVINDAVCFDPPERVRAEWRSMGVDFTDAEWAQHTEKVRAMIHVSRVTEEELNRNNRMLRAGATKLGLRDHWANERNCVNCMQCGFCHNGCHYDTKQNMLVTYLHAGLQGPGDLRIYCNCAADRIVTSGDHVEGIEGRFLDVDGKERHRIRVNARAFVLAAGAIASSHLLLSNRIASKTAGRGVVLHPSVLMVGQFPYEIKPNQGIPMAYSVHDFGVNRRQETTRQEYDAAGGEFMIESITLPMMEFSMGMPGGPLEHHDFLAKFNHLAITGMLARDQSRGRVSLIEDNRMSFAYEVGLEDRKSLAKASEVVGKMWFALGAERIATRHPSVPFLNRPEDIPRLTDAFLHDAERMKLASAHPQSGNAIGSDPARSTVDSDGRVRGLSNLVIADASVFPNAVGVNPQLTVMVIASILADRMNRDWANRYGAIVLNTSSGQAGSLARPMYFRRDALARAFEGAKSGRPVSVLTSSGKAASSDGGWSIDPASLDITNDAAWRGFLARDEKLPVDAPLFRSGFSRTFSGDGAGITGVAHPYRTDLFAKCQVREESVPSLGRGLLVEYLDPPYSASTEFLKAIDDQTILGRAFAGAAGAGPAQVDFVLVRRYPFEGMTPDDHEKIFLRSTPPKPSDLAGAWEGWLVGEARWSEPLVHVRFLPDQKGWSAHFRLGSKLQGSTPVTASTDGAVGTIATDAPFRSELRRVNAEWCVGKLSAPSAQLAGWVPEGSEWSPSDASSENRTLRVVLRHLADAEALKE